MRFGAAPEAEPSLGRARLLIPEWSHLSVGCAEDEFQVGGFAHQAAAECYGWCGFQELRGCQPAQLARRHVSAIVGYPSRIGRASTGTGEGHVL